MTDPHKVKEIYLIISFIICFIFMFISIYISVFRDGQRVIEALRPLFPDVSCKFGRLFFQLLGFRSQLNLPRGKLDGMTLYVSFSGESKPSQSLSRRDRIFEVTFIPRGLLDKAPENLADGKKYLEIKSHDAVLKKNLASDDGLLDALYELYRKWNGVSLVSVCLNKNGIEVCCGISPYTVDKNNITELMDHCVKACEQALKAAAREGIQLNAPNPFQDFQGAPGISHNPELEARSDEALYNSLDGSSNENGKNDELKLFL